MLDQINQKITEEKLRIFTPIPKQIEFHMTDKRSRWELAGNRCGKTVGGGLLVTLLALGKSALKYMNEWPLFFLNEFTRLSTEAPTAELRQEYASMANQMYVEDLVAKYRQIAIDAPKKARIWVCSETYEVQRDVVQKELIGDPETLIGGWIPVSEIKGKPVNRLSKVIDYIKLKSGATIGFKSYDQGRRKFQGTSQHIVWEDEEPPEDVRSEIRLRLLDTKGLEIGTMTPLSGITHIYDSIYLNDTKPPENRDPEVFCLIASWDDNPYLSQDEKDRLEANMSEADIEARKYGRFVMPGKCVFDSQMVQKGLAKCYAGERGNLEWTSDQKGKVDWIPDPKGDYEVWFHPDKEKKYEFLMAADVAEGLEHGDYDAVGVLNRYEMRLDAVYHGKVDPDVYADYIHKLAVYYNRPVVAPEANNHGLTTISFLKIEYQDIFRMMIYDKISDSEHEKLGWHTTPKTRPLIVDAVKRAVREDTFICYWRRFYEECMNFVRHPNGKEAARQGFWDDGVMMTGILLHLHNTIPLYRDMPSAFVAGAGENKRAGWQKDGTFIHPSILEDRQRQESRDNWGDDDG